MFYFYDEIMSLAEEVKVYKISATEINNAMMGGVSLNELEAVHFARLIDELACDVKKIYVDSPDVVQSKFGSRISIISSKQLSVMEGKRKKAPAGAIKIISEHKADSKYPVASAASVIAKVTREREVDRIKEVIGDDFGSGYPSDEQTVEYIRRNLGSNALKQFLRERWHTVSDIRQRHMPEFLDKD